MKKIMEDLEEVKFEIGKKAFEPKVMHCSEDGRKMEPAKLEINLQMGISLKLNGFRCSKCGEQYLSLKEATKLDRAMIINRIMKQDFKMERKLSFDGDNYTFRVPKEFTKDIHKKKIEIIPLGAKQFCGQIR